MYLCTKNDKNSKDMRKFFLRTTKKSGEATLFFQLRSKKHSLSLNHVNTGVKVNISKWLAVQADEEAKDEWKDTPEGKEVYRQLRAIDEAINKLLECSQGGKSDVEAVIKEFNAEAENNANRAKKTHEKQRKTEERKEILNYLRYFIEGISTGKILFKERRIYTKGTIQNYISLEHYLRTYLNDCPHLKFDEITSEMAAEFRQYLSGNNLMPQTVNGLISNMRALVNQAANDKLVTDFSVTRHWGKAAVEESETRKEIYLTDAEINALSEMPLTDADEQAARDLFLFGYAVGQRYSDYGDISKEDIIEFEGHIILDRRQRKTRSKVVVEIEDKRALEIIRKYNKELPRIEHTKFNRTIKNLFARLRFIVPSLGDMVTTTLSGKEKTSEEYFSKLIDKKNRGEKMTEAEARAYLFDIEKQKIYGGSGKQIYRRDTKGRILKPKWTLVGSHTARRSFVTNQIEEGSLDRSEIRNITGHTSDKVLEAYIRTEDKEIRRAIEIGSKRREARKKQSAKSVSITKAN